MPMHDRLDPVTQSLSLDPGALHLTRFCRNDPARGVVLCWHGAIESGRIFHSRSGKGLAPWLADQGYDVFVVDQRGRGQAPPRPARGVPIEQSDVIIDEIPAAIQACLAEAKAPSLHLVAHSWGGVLAASSLARFPTLRHQVTTQVYFGAKRRVHCRTLQRLLYVDLIWKGIAPLVRQVCGYVPARALHWGSDDEYAGSHRQGAAWVGRHPWIDTRDAFDYASALAGGGLPPTLHLAGLADRALGHPDDVAHFADECGPHRQQRIILGQAQGFTRAYGHLDMLTHPRAIDEVFPYLPMWFESQSTDMGQST